MKQDLPLRINNRARAEDIFITVQGGVERQDHGPPLLHPPAVKRLKLPNLSLGAYCLLHDRSKQPTNQPTQPELVSSTHTCGP